YKVIVATIGCIVNDNSESASLRSFHEGQASLDSVVSLKIRIEVDHDILFWGRHRLCGMTDARAVQELERQRSTDRRTRASTSQQGCKSPRLEPLDGSLRIRLTNILNCKL